VYTRLSGTNDRAPFRPERTGNFPVAANETAADMLCCALYPRIQTFPSTDLHLHGGGLVSRGVEALTIKELVGRTIDRPQDIPPDVCVFGISGPRWAILYQAQQVI
jgi:hypothetical protein